MTLVGSIELTVFWLLVIVAVVALLTKRIRVPYTVALVVAGLVLAVFPGTPKLRLTPELIVAVFLPVLVFEAAYNLNFRALRETVRPIVILAVPGVILTATLVALLIHFAGGFGWALAFLFGAIVAATDPISVVAIFRDVGAPVRLRAILEGESLFNDGTAIVVFSLILGVIGAGEFHALDSIERFLLVVVGGAAIGLLLGYGFSFLLSQVDDYLIETVLTLLLAYGSYFIAEQLGVSGIIAIACAALLVGNYAQRVALSPTSQIAVGLSWQFFGFIANSLIFLAVGLQVDATLLVRDWPLLLLAVASVLVARGVVVGVFGGLLRLLRVPDVAPASWLPVLVWGGLRGAVSLALALSVPAFIGSTGTPFPERNTILVMTFGVILFSLLVQALTMRPLLTRLRLTATSGELGEYERLQALLRATREALHALEVEGTRGEITPDNYDELRADYEERRRLLLDRLRDLHVPDHTRREQALRAERRGLLQVERSTWRDMLAAGEIGDDTYQELIADVDRRRDQLDRDTDAARRHQPLPGVALPEAEVPHRPPSG